MLPSLESDETAGALQTASVSLADRKKLAEGFNGEAGRGSRFSLPLVSSAGTGNTAWSSTAGKISPQYERTPELSEKPGRKFHGTGI